jgi:aryl-alcohol dehydrogenase-like predicted oxidoreductase
MQYRQLGSSSLMVSPIGFGCMSLKASAPDAEPILKKAIELGINYFDTADLYEQGANESLVGRALGGERKKIILATKVGNQWRQDGSGWDWNPSKKYILEAVEKSLQRLQTDYIDLYQLHGGTIEDPVDETIEAFEQLVDQGKILYYGISSIRPNVIRRWVESSRLVSVMMQYSLLDRRPEEEMMDLLHKKKISVLARGGVAQGLLVNKPSKPYLDLSLEEVQKAADIVKELSTQRTPAQTAIQYTLAHPAVASAVVGMHTMQQLEEAVGAISAPRISTEERNRLAKFARPNQYKEHR